MKQRLFDSFDILIQQQVIMVSECDILNTCVNDYLFEMDNVLMSWTLISSMPLKNWESFRFMLCYGVKVRELIFDITLLELV